MLSWNRGPCCSNVWPSPSTAVKWTSTRNTCQTYKVNTTGDITITWQPVFHIYSNWFQIVGWILTCMFNYKCIEWKLVCVCRASGGEPAAASGAHPSCSGLPVLQSAAAAHVASTPNLTVAHHDHRTGEHWALCLLHCSSFSHIFIHSTSVPCRFRCFYWWSRS